MYTNTHITHTQPPARNATVVFFHTKGRGKDGGMVAAPLQVELDPSSLFISSPSPSASLAAASASSAGTEGTFIVIETLLSYCGALKAIDS